MQDWNKEALSCQRGKGSPNLAKRLLSSERKCLANSVKMLAAASISPMKQNVKLCVRTWFKQWKWAFGLYCSRFLTWHCSMDGQRSRKSRISLGQQVTAQNFTAPIKGWSAAFISVFFDDAWLQKWKRGQQAAGRPCSPTWASFEDEDKDPY